MGVAALAVVAVGVAVAIDLNQQAPVVAPTAPTEPVSTPSDPPPASPTDVPTTSPATTPATTPVETPTQSPRTTTGQEALPELEPVDIRSDSERPGGVVVSIAGIEQVAGEAVLPGEVAGPALRLRIRVDNRSSAAISLDAVVVNGYRGENRTPVETLVSPGGKPFGGTLAAGAQADGVYLFRVDPQERSDVTFTVDLQAGEPASVFRGDARG